MANHRVLAAGSTSATSRPPMAGVPAAQRAPTRRLDLPPPGAARGEHHVAAGSGEANATGTTAMLGFATRPSRWGSTPWVDREADDFLCVYRRRAPITTNAIHAGDVRVGGERSLVAELHHLSGYESCPPGAHRQRRAYKSSANDIRGSILTRFTCIAKSRASPENLWLVLKRQVEEAIKLRGARPNLEVRGEPQHYVVEGDAGSLQLGPNWLSVRARKSYAAQQWRAIADEIKADILAGGLARRVHPALLSAMRR